MTPDKLREVVKKYKTVLANTGCPLKQMEDYSKVGWQVDEITSHAHWMVYQIEPFIDEGRIEKSMRWLGFIQGFLFSMGIRTLDQLKDDSRPNTIH